MMARPRARRFLRPPTPEDPSAVQPLPKRWRRQFRRSLVFLRPDWVRVATVVLLTILVSMLGCLVLMASRRLGVDISGRC